MTKGQFIHVGHSYEAQNNKEYMYNRLARKSFGMLKIHNDCILLSYSCGIRGKKEDEQYKNYQV